MSEAEAAVKGQMNRVLTQPLPGSLETD